MSKEDLQRFCRSVLEDAKLREQLIIYTDREEFIIKVLEAGKKAGFDFSRCFHPAPEGAGDRL